MHRTASPALLRIDGATFRGDYHAAMNPLRRVLLPFALSLTGSLVLLHADTATLRPAADTTLWELNPNNNLGAASLAGGTTAGINGGAASQCRPVLRFDFSSIPAGATITSVKMTVRVSKVPSGAVSSTFNLHRLLVSWDEGSKGGNTGAAAGANEATWIKRGAAGNWSAPGAQAGVDYTAAVSGSRLLGGVASYTFDSSAGLVADVQGWVNNSAANFGWIMISSAEASPRSAKRITSREGGASAPILVVEYTAGAAGTAPSITLQPKPLTVYGGLPASLRVTAVGTEPLSFQWSKDGAPIALATNATIALPSTSAADRGNYIVKVTNATGSVSSNPALLDVVPPPSFDKVALEGGNLVMTFKIVAGHNMAVQGATDFPNSWITITNIAAPLEIPAARALDAISGALRFYRLQPTPLP